MIDRFKGKRENKRWMQSLSEKNFFHKRNTANQKNKIMETSFKLIKNTFYKKKKKIFYKRKAIKKLTLLQPDLMKRRNVEKGSLCRMTLC
jgi:hypothetical protein